jgi:hypothetical protein
VAALVASQDGGGAKLSEHDAARERLTDAEGRLKRFQDAIAACRVP